MISDNINQDNTEPFDGLIIKGVGGLYTVRRGDGICVKAKPRGIFRKKRIIPTVGDYVYVEPTTDPDVPYAISDIQPRKNLMIRPPIANVDLLFLTFSTMQPSPYLELLDKLLILCHKNNIIPVIWITKMDLDPETGRAMRDIYHGVGYEVICTSFEEVPDKSIFIKYFNHRTVGFAGQSGVGKSTLCNLLTGISEREVGKISDRLNQGKHTTRHVELFPFAQGYLIDSPGFTNLDIMEADISVSDIRQGYPEYDKIRGQCQFDDCLHLGEKGCAVDKSGIHPGRLDRYRAFIKTARDNEYNKRNKRENRHVAEDER
ncbi:MAG: ribosome small subunit-dependent GTPase A [Clostridiaceae bacterium]|nr:ribosome small subunit-dependent GTPase A [Clostridiaceae bacterium]